MTAKTTPMALVDIEKEFAQFEENPNAEPSYTSFELGDFVIDTEKAEGGAWCHLSKETYGENGPQFRIRRVLSEAFDAAQKRIQRFLVARFGTNYEWAKLPEMIRKWVTIQRATAVLTDWKHIRFKGDTEDRPFNEKNVTLALQNPDSRVLDFVSQQMLNDENYKQAEDEALEKN